MSIFKPVKSEKLVISIRLDSNILEEIDQVSSKAGMSRNEFIVQSLRYALDNLETTEK